MKSTFGPGRIGGVAAAFLVAAAVAGSPTLKDENESLLEQIRQTHRLGDDQIAAVRAIFARSGFIGQGNPRIVRHPMSTEECRSRVAAANVRHADPVHEKICGAPYMAPLYDPATESASDAAACIDKFEFPDIPCAYPVVWVRAREAAELCAAVGKRLCDAHEWEGACAGVLEPPDYRFDLARGVEPGQAISRMRAAHNQAHGASKVWSYGPEYRTGVCATSGSKSPSCDGGGWELCGSNTFPAGAFPGCRSALDVWDLNGNAAEHMNLPLSEEQMASRGSLELGYTEMKGSWFVFDKIKAHEDACRWRAPFWHGGKVMAANSHHNYHLGFRCCKTLEAAPAKRPAETAP